MGLGDAFGDVLDAVNPVDEIIDFGENVMDGDVIGAFGNVIDAATPLDEAVSAVNHLLRTGGGGGVNKPGLQTPTATPLPTTQGQSVLPTPPAQPAASSFGAEGEVDVETQYLYEDAGKFEAASESYASITSAAQGLTIDPAAFSFIGGQASAAYNDFQATMVALLGTAPPALTGFAESLRLTGNAYDETDQASKGAQDKDVDTKYTEPTDSGGGGGTGGGGTGGGGTGGGGTGGGGSASVDDPRVDGSLEGETGDDEARAEADAKADQLDARADALDRQADQADQHADKAQEQAEALDAQIDELEEQAAELDRSATETEYRATELDLKAEQQEAAGDPDAALQTRTDSAALRADAAAQRAEAAEIREQIAKLEESRDDAIEEMTDAREDAAELRDKAAELRDQAAELHHDATGLDHGGDVEIADDAQVDTDAGVDTDANVDGDVDGGTGETGGTDGTGETGGETDGTGETGDGPASDTDTDVSEQPSGDEVPTDGQPTPTPEGEGDQGVHLQSPLEAFAQPMRDQPVAAPAWQTRLSS